jgi:hypothetical protein
MIGALGTANHLGHEVDSDELLPRRAQRYHQQSSIGKLFANRVS